MIPKSQFDIVPRDIEKSELLDLVYFVDEVFSEETVIYLYIHPHHPPSEQMTRTISSSEFKFSPAVGGNSILNPLLFPRLPAAPSSSPSSGV